MNKTNKTNKKNGKRFFEWFDEITDIAIVFMVWCFIIAFWVALGAIIAYACIMILQEPI